MLAAEQANVVVGAANPGRVAAAVATAKSGAKIIVLVFDFTFEPGANSGGFRHNK